MKPSQHNLHQASHHRVLRILSLDHNTSTACHHEYHDSTILPVSLLPSEAGLDLDMASASPQPPHGVRSPAPGPGDAGLLVAATWHSALS